MPKKHTNIHKRKDGRWEARVKIGKNENGKTIYKSLYAKKYDEVKQKLEDYIHTYTLEHDKKLFRQVGLTYFKTIENNVKESTYLKYIYIFEHYLIDLHEVDISIITTSYLQKFMNKQSYSKSTKTIMLTIIKSIINFAKEDGILNIDIHHVFINGTKKTQSYLTLNEQKDLEEAIKNINKPYILGIYLGLYTGLRIGEVCALKWGDIDLIQNTITINKTLQRIYDKNINKTKIVITSPKSIQSNRILPISKQFASVLEKYKSTDENYILTSKSKYMEPRLLEYHLKKILIQYDLPIIHFHTLRHTFTTRCIELQFDTKVLSELLGHSSVTFTLDKYGHCTLDSKRTYIDKLTINGQ